MDILWAALGISVIVFFVFYVLASHWQKLLRQQSFMVRRLAERVRALEEIGDPAFRQRLGESAPLPLEQVMTLSFRLTERFWRDTLGLKAGEREFIRTFGSFVGSVKLDRWRSHTVATVTEVLPESKTARWETRSVDFFPDSAAEDTGLSLWELRLAPPEESAERPPSLDLSLHRDSVKLRGYLLPCNVSGPGNGRHVCFTAPEPAVLLDIPLDAAHLERFRSTDPAQEMGGEEPDIHSHAPGSDVVSWQAFYANCDSETGIEWQLRVRDLRIKAEWERWKTLDSRTVPFVRAG
jgi:hypothetical protein